ncbi:MAG: cytochrome C [Gallionellales bacterium GWE2_58_10]|nr:MAG: cytochrome C [Gallionellales bacterium GWE2_58_10]OGT05760.1 MAG: cytochrome C [Gallionellales bacterium RBG_16_57_15]
MKRIGLTALIFLGIFTLNTAFGGNESINPEMHHHHGMDTADKRTSLELSPEMKQHQLSNMREHLAAVQSIIRLMSENKFEEASGIAHAKLGLTPEMQQMCSMFENEQFMAMGFEFHRSGDELGKVLKTRNMKASLRALNKTMAYCTECHAAFRQ